MRSARSHAQWNVRAFVQSFNDSGREDRQEGETMPISRFGVAALHLQMR